MAGEWAIDLDNHDEHVYLDVYHFSFPTGGNMVNGV